MGGMFLLHTRQSISMGGSVMKYHGCHRGRSQGNSECLTTTTRWQYGVRGNTMVARACLRKKAGALTRSHEPGIFSLVQDAPDDIFDHIEMRASEKERVPPRPRVGVDDQRRHLDVVV